MKVLTLFLFVFFSFILSPSLRAQDPHVHTRFIKESKTTMVETDLMYLINTPVQFVQVGLVARHPGERLEKPPKKIDLLIWSFSRDVMYRADKDHTVILRADGESWSITPELYAVFKGDTKNGQDVFWNEKRPVIGEPSPLPDNAQVRAQGGVNGLFMEQIFVELKPEQLTKIANAKKVEIQLGISKFGFTDEYLSTTRDFNSRLIPGSKSGADSNAQQSASTQSGNSGAPIDAGVVNGIAIDLPRPEYSSMARGARASGSVNVLVTIDETGKVIAARAITGHPMLREAAEAAARKARFKPTMISGQPVQVTGIIVYNFAP